jgi:hypothetical protein
VKLVGVLLTACVVLAAAQATLAVICVLLLAWVVYGLFVFPKEMIGLLAIFAVLGLLHAQPLACLGLVTLAIIAKLILRY